MANLTPQFKQFKQPLAETRQRAPGIYQGGVKVSAPQFGAAPAGGQNNPGTFPGGGQPGGSGSPPLLPGGGGSGQTGPGIPGTGGGEPGAGGGAFNPWTSGEFGSTLTGGWQPTQAPQWQGSNATGMYEDLYGRATEGSVQNFNRAANRLRERLDSSTQGNVDAAKNSGLSRGFGTSGVNDANIQNQMDAGQNAYAQGLVGLESEFEQNRLAGLNTALGATNGLQGGNEAFNEFQQGNWKAGNEMEGNRRQFIDSKLFELLNNRERNSANWREAQLGSKTSLTQGRESNELERMMEELRQQNENWRLGVGGGF